MSTVLLSRPAFSLLVVQVFFTIVANGELQKFNDTSCLTECTYDTTDYNYTCSYSGCTQLPSELPTGVVQLDLRGNKITVITPLLRDYSSLRDLDLSENLIDSIQDEAFPGNMITLNLSGNGITLSVLSGKAFDGLGKLEYLNLADNNLGNLTEDNIFWRKMGEVKSLDLSGNDIHFIAHNALTDLRSLESIDLSRNELTVLEMEDFFGLRKLLQVNFSMNQVDRIPDRLFHGLDRAKLVDLSDNLIETISEGSFEEAFALETLHLQRNRIRSIPSSLFQEAKSLKHLILDANPLESIGTEALPSTLKSLSIQNCDVLLEVGDVFKHPTQLTTVTITNNKILELVSFGGVAVDVQELDLSNNALTILPPNLVNWTNLISVNLDGNYWDCDCSMAWVKEYPMVSNSIVCYNPYHLRGTRATDVDTPQFSCSIPQRYRRQAAIILAVIFTVVVLTAIALFLRRYRHRIWPLHGLGKYETLYSSAEAAADDEASTPVTIKMSAQDNDPVPV